MDPFLDDLFRTEQRFEGSDVEEEVFNVDNPEASGAADEKPTTEDQKKGKEKEGYLFYDDGKGARYVCTLCYPTFAENPDTNVFERAGKQFRGVFAKNSSEQNFAKHQLLHEKKSTTTKPPSATPNRRSTSSPAPKAPPS